MMRWFYIKVSHRCKTRSSFLSTYLIRGWKQLNLMRFVLHVFSKCPLRLAIMNDMRNACIMFYPNVTACMLLACILRQTAMQLTRAPSALQQSCLAFPFPSLAPSIACLTSSPIIKSVASNMQTLRRRKHLCRLLHRHRQLQPQPGHL